MKLLDIKKIHQGKYLSYYEALYLTSEGNIKNYELISRNPNLTKDNFGDVNPQGVGLVPLSMDEEKILLQKEFRLATNNWVYNFPAGLIDKDETPIDAAKRELKEETGVTLKEIIDVLPPSFASQGTSDESMVIVICKCEGEISKSIYAEEEIIAKWYTKQEIKELLKQKVYMSVRTQMFLYDWVHK